MSAGSTQRPRPHRGHVPEPEIAGTLWERPGEEEGTPFLVEVLRPAVLCGPENPTPEQVALGGRLRYPGIVLRPERWERWRVLAQSLEAAKNLVRTRFARLVDHRWISGPGVTA